MVEGRHKFRQLSLILFCLSLLNDHEEELTLNSNLGLFSFESPHCFCFSHSITSSGYILAFHQVTPQKSVLW